MARYIAFLRAVNVGGHTVKMDALRRLFEDIGFTGVGTFIASGNVVFEAPTNDARTLEKTIEVRLAAALGYEVATFVRTAAELAALARATPFPQAVLDAAVALNVAFLAAPLDEAATQKLAALTTDIDEFRVNGHEVFWLCRRRQSDSTFSNALLEKTTGRPSTLRGINTIRRMAAKFAAGG